MLWDSKHSFHFHSNNKKVDIWQIIVKNMNIDVLAANKKLAIYFSPFAEKKQ